MSDPKNLTIPRRRALQLMGGSAAAIALPRVVRAQGAKQAHKVSVGRIPWAAGNSDRKSVV